ncbi:class I SAM-dependent methyltransferase [Solirhodobacter olei]|uniref:class I SAM-dependent methyltransferase n=1 Tax=Solirhodobacter olei TaxID=2493082 RepID=UPI000FDC9265|nr:methyltransferase [Solirhodobacter olei]
MRSARLSHALSTGALTLPEGPVAVFRPQASDDLSALGRERVRVITGFKPDYDSFAVRGYAVAVAPEGSYAAALVCLPRARAEARALIAAAAAHLPKGAPLIVDGQKTDGVDAMLRELRGRAEVGEAEAKAHGKLAVVAAPGPEAFSDWAAAPLELPEGFRTLPGVFSADGVDPASAMLAAALPAKLPRRVGDLGAGWGYLARAVLAREGVESLELIEAEADALDCARANVTDPRARFTWADATQGRPGPFDAVVMNPPFHNGRSADPALGLAFIRAAAHALTPSGTLWMVANRHLPYEAALREAFREVEEVAGDTRFRVLRAARPQKR